MVSNWFIVVPKIRRIWSGEEVVMSNVLRTMNGNVATSVGKYGASASSPPNATTQASNNAVVVNAASEGESSTEQNNIVLQEKENIPAPVEIDLYHLNKVINSLTKKR
jgi:hypothetical protein